MHQRSMCQNDQRAKIIINYQLSPIINLQALPPTNYKHGTISLPLGHNIAYRVHTVPSIVMMKLWTGVKGSTGGVRLTLKGQRGEESRRGTLSL